MELSTCPDCGSTNITLRCKEDSFRYGEGDNAPIIKYDFILLTCNDCKLQYTDERAENAKQKAIDKHLEFLKQFK